ncbi:MAG TPA: DUF2807 domain-containing protein, partial [Candidatus Acidoferrum sp.]|nr:DUF2807 domain-containing protein [Candidatus Acidoferrum sp.]
LKDFVNVRAQGDFALVVRQQPGFSVQYVAAAPSAGQFHASIQGDTLSLGGYGNIGEDKPATVIVGMPHLQRLVSIADIDLTVEGFDDGEPAISANQSSLLTLRGNSAPTQVRVQNVRKLQLDAISQTHATLHVSGNTVIVPLRE